MLEILTTSYEDRTRYFAELLVSWPSVTDSIGERELSRKLTDELRQWPVFEHYPEDVQQVPAQGIYDRESVTALVRGRGPATVILVGHFDTVAIDDYRELSPLACHPTDLAKALISALRESGENPLALNDLESGNFLPGRGMLDMKSGLAAGLAVLERFASTQERVGNLLFVACPDEEVNSAGMRSAVEHLKPYLETNDLDVKLIINLDAICDEGDGSGGRVVSMGCIGKLLVSALVVGKEAHACYPLSGVNAAYLASELVCEMEYEAGLGEMVDGALCSPPTILGLKDLKPAYDVTLPSRVWAFWNVLMHERTIAQTLTTCLEIGRRAAGRARERINSRARRIEGGPDPSKAWANIDVMTFSELRNLAQVADHAFEAEFAHLAQELSQRQDLDLPTRSRELVEFTWRRSGIKDPVIVFCVGSMPYAAVRWGADAKSVEAAINKSMNEVSSYFGQTISKQPFFPAIADMSFIAPMGEEERNALAANTPLWGTSIVLSDRPSERLAAPTINVGPWGRDYHHWLERVNVDFGFRVLPALVASIANEVLASESVLVPA